jgi:hypothetical protein
MLWPLIRPRSVIVTLTIQVQNQGKQQYLSNRYTNWEDFRHFVNEELSLKVTIETRENIEAAVKYFNDTIQWASWNLTPEHTDLTITTDYIVLIKKKKAEKRKLRKNWRRLRTAEGKRIINSATQELKQLLKTYKNYGINTFLQGLTPTDSIDCSLWKVTKQIKQILKSSPPPQDNPRNMGPKPRWKNIPLC